MIEKLDGMSKDIVKENVEKLKELFPSIVKEGKIDFEELELLLGENINRASEQYSFTWNGKTEATKLAQKRSTGTLRPCKEDSVGRNGEKGVWDNETQNLYIEGDNLEVLKLLQTSYNGKIKMIYIDPPYNTGHDFVYKDNFEDNLKNYKEITGQAQKSNAESDGRYHTNWLNMMYPRLKLARNLLSPDGVIFISIDDNEVDNLKKICNEIFGENNYLTTFTIQVRYADKSLNEEKYFKPLVEYILAYAKDSRLYIPNQPTEEYGLEKFIFKIDETEQGQLIDVDGDKVEIFKPGQWNISKIENGSLDLLKETWISGSVYTTMSYGKVFKRVVEPRINIDGLGCLYKVYGRGEDGLGYRYYTGPQKSGSTRGKMYSGVPLSRAQEIADGKMSIRKKPIHNFYDFSADFGNIRHEGDVPFNSGKKPVKLLKQLINYVNEKDIIILDFFSGSSSTAHAVMQLNAEDGGNRRFIMVQLPEISEDKTDVTTFKNICEIGKERIRRAGKKVKEELYATCSKGYAVEDMLNEKEKQELEELTTRASNLDIGFKVLKLDTSNLVKWNNEPTSDIEEVERRIQESMDYLQEGRTALDLVYEIILKYGLDPTAPVTETANQKAHIIEGGDYKFLISSEPNLTLEDIETFANEPVGTYLFADRCFSDDNLLINAEEILKSKNKEMRVF